MSELYFLSASDLAQAIRSRQVSSAEVVEAHLQRIGAVNPDLNAFVRLAEGPARAQARAADSALASGSHYGPLHGVPITLKDSLDTADLVTTWGTRGRADFVPREDATVVARLRAAGAIVLGKTNTPEFTLAGVTDNFIVGRTSNPYDLSRTPAGSSGGAAAIVAAGGSPLDLGSDTGGSIRLPSHFCGIAGIRPTSGRVPRTGHAVSFDIGGLDALTQIGPMARSVDDLILTLPLIAGPDWRDPAIVPVPLGKPQSVDWRQVNVAFYTENGVRLSTPETVAVVRAAADVLKDRGASVSEARPPGVTEAPALWRALFLADGGEGVHKMCTAVGTSELHPTLSWTQSAVAVSRGEFAELLVTWNLYRSRMLSFMEEFELILCPVSASAATRHDDEAGPDFSYCSPYNLTGWPAAVVRGGASASGLPIGVQIVARPWREEIALAGAQCIETALGGWQPPPI